MSDGEIQIIQPLTPTMETVLEALRMGNTRRASAEFAGIGKTTLYRWMEENGTFRDAIQKAEADAEVRNVAIIQQSAKKSWQAAAWWLERRRHEDWRERKDVNSNLDAEIARLLACLAGTGETEASEGVTGASESARDNYRLLDDGTGA